ncbi:2'-5' RNA ligase [Sphingomonas laterariae]|uniref:RNA 2',3'-cyclic phosphodiesterase n=1 Tax=Edaphosphingomonas laterariae TaxID=861865 RepID=A0A239DKD7_9SPHN|nr:RNA 2',3'-cyclic phosphodiesterase [Sphingomonas laterariae]SNS32896.1 2'-5' RNA ligase [Sphingomonas laterariae]
MHRLFVALRPPRAMRERLLGLMGGIAGARWQDDSQLHLTLRFIGEVDRHMAEDVAAALGTVHHPRFALTLDGLGQFGRGGRIDTLWAGVTPHDAVTALHNKVDQALARVGVAPDTRAFLPHITIARFGRKSGPADAMLAQAAGLASEPMEMTDFCLYESHLSSEGALYEIVNRYPLAEPPTA